MAPKPRQTNKTQTLVAKTSSSAPAHTAAVTEADKVSADLQYCYAKLSELKDLIIAETDGRQLKDHVTRFGNFLVSHSVCEIATS